MDEAMYHRQQGPSPMPPKKPLQTVTVDDLAKQFKVDTLEDFDQQVSEAESSYSYVYKEALGEGMSEEEAEQAAMKAEQAERDEAVTKYMDAITAVADDLYGKHGLTLVPIRPSAGFPPGGAVDRARSGPLPPRMERRLARRLRGPQGALHGRTAHAVARLSRAAGAPVTTSTYRSRMPVANRRAHAKA